MHSFTGGEFIVMGVPGAKLDIATQAIIKRTKPAGFILFARNIRSPEQLRALTDDLRASVDYDPIITIDQEGGRVSRLKEFMAEPPSAKEFTDYGDLSLIKDHGEITGKLLRFFGFNLNLAPVLDVLVDEKNDNSLKGRTYGKTPSQVVQNAGTFAEAMKAEGILCCGKHYPGYSNAEVDPHKDLPAVQRSLSDLLGLEWQSFQRLLPILDLVMIGHVSYPLIDDSGLPATLSRVMVNNTLRQGWKFGGCTITDDMDMGAIKSRYGGAEAAATALRAGNDLMLVCHAIDSVPEIAEAIARAPQDLLEESYSRILQLRKKLCAPSPFSLFDFAKLDKRVAELRDKISVPSARA